MPVTVWATDIIQHGHEAANLQLESHLPKSTALMDANALILLSLGLGWGAAGNVLSTVELVMSWHKTAANSKRQIMWHFALYKGYLAGLSWMDWTMLLPAWVPGENKQTEWFFMTRDDNNTQPQSIFVFLLRTLTQGDVCDDTTKYERCQKGQRDDEAIEEAVIALSNTVPHPWAVVIESLWGGKNKSIPEIRHVF